MTRKELIRLIVDDLTMKVGDSDASAIYCNMYEIRDVIKALKKHLGAYLEEGEGKGTFSIGDTVRLKGILSMDMSVCSTVKMDVGTPYVVCMWFTEDGRLQIEDIPVEALEKVTDKKTTV